MSVADGTFGRLVGVYRLPAVVVAIVVSACSSDGDINYAGYLPAAVQVETKSVYRDRQFGECSVEVFEMTGAFSQTLTASGISALTEPTALASTGKVREGVRASYAPWQRAALLAPDVPAAVRSKASWTRQCLNGFGDIVSSYVAALDGAEGYFTYSIAPDRITKPDLIVILPKENVVIVAPY